MFDENSEISQLLGLHQPGVRAHGHDDHGHGGHAQHKPAHHEEKIPHGLPIAQESAPAIASAAVLESTFVDALGEMRSEPSRLKSLLIYPVIFVIAFAFFYVVLNFPAILAQVEGWFAKPQEEQILGEDMTAYYAWINNYYYMVSDSNLLDPNNDIDKDGLSNHDEFKIRTSPVVVDSDSDGFTDGIEVINNHNPWGRGPLTDKQRKLAEALDLVVINNRISYNVSQNRGGSVAGATTIDYDLEKPGRLSIPKLNLTVPLVWSKDPANFDADLSQGVIHYPGTAMPGQTGTIYVSGHSSDYLWKKNPYHAVFAKLNFLAPGDDIFIDVYGKDGKVFNYRYQVTTSKTYAPDDQTQFIDNSGSKLNLSTCWPIGTQKDRLVVSAVPVAL